MGGFRHLDIYIAVFVGFSSIRALSISIKLYFPYTFSISEAERLRRPSFKILNTKISYPLKFPMTSDLQRS